MNSNKLDSALTSIKEIRKENKEKKDKIEALRDEIALNNSKISWLKEDIEDMICNCFSDVSNVSIKNDYITIKFNDVINIQDIVDWSTLYNIDLKTINIEIYDDEELILYISLKP